MENTTAEKQKYMEISTQRRPNEVFDHKIDNPATLRERNCISGVKESQAFRDQVNQLEDQYRLFKVEFDKKEIQAQKAYSEFSAATKKAWEDLWTGIEKASKKIH